MVRAIGGPVEVLHLLADLGSGGGQRLVLDTLRHLDPERYRVTVAHLGPDETMAPDYEAAGLPPFLLPGRSGARRVTTAAAILRIVHRHRIQLIHTHGGREKRLGEAVAFLSRRPCIQHVHSVSAGGTSGPARPAPLHRRLQSRVLERHFIAVSEAAYDERQAWLRAAGDGIHLVRNGIETARFTGVAVDDARRQVRRELGISADAPMVVTVGRLVPTKAVDHLVSAASELVTQWPALVVLVVGDGPQRAPLEREVAEADLAAHFRFVGNRRDVPELLAASDVFAFPTVLEGFGLAAVEAMAAGLPVVASDLPALQAIVDEGRTGLLVPAGDAGALAAALGRVLGDRPRARQMGHEGRRRAVDQFDITTTAARLAQVYDTVLRGVTPH